MGPALADGASVPAEHVTSTGTEYVWDRSDIKAYTPEADAPPSFEPLPWVEATEFADWQEVARLGAELFDVPVALGGQLKEWVHKTLDAALSPEEFVLRATRFVQDEIRYVAVEVGMSRRRPTDPEVVMRRRYGDCKDKAALLTSMLLLGRVSARPVLVSTNHGRSLDGWAASPLAFDHAIVLARLGDGDPLFIDPTLTLQGGGLERMQYSMFDRVLELDPATTALRKTKREPAEEPSPLVRDEFHVATPETSGPTLLDSTRVYRGFLADAMRATVRAMTKEQLRRANLNRYAQDYPGIVDVGDVEVTDDRDRNELSVVDHFAIPAFWQPGQAAPFLAQIHARVIDSFLDRPSTAERTAPLGLLYPFHARYEVEVLLPLDLPLKPETMGAETRSFRYTFTAFSEHKHLSYTFDLKNLAREVKVVDLAEHAARVDEVRATLLRNLTYRPAPADGPNWPIIALVVLAVPASAWGARRAYLYDPPAHEPKDADPRWPGLGGWLTVLGIYVVLLTLGTAYEVAKLAPVIASKARWATITADASSHSPMLGPLVAGEVLFEIALTAFGAMMVFAYFRRKRSFPLHFAAVSAARVALGLGDIVGASATAPGHDMRDAVSRTVGAFLWAVVWIAYLRASRRASATFVR